MRCTSGIAPAVMWRALRSQLLDDVDGDAGREQRFGGRKTDASGALRRVASPALEHYPRGRGGGLVTARAEPELGGGVGAGVEGVATGGRAERGG